MLTFKTTILDFLFPKICEHCGGSFQEGLSNILCRRCFDLITPYEEPACEHCGVSVPPGAFEGAEKIRCGDCGTGSYFLDHVRSFGAYEGPLRIAHHAFKFEGMESLLTELAGKMVQAVPDSYWREGKTLVPVPQSPEKERERGYNPAGLLATELSRVTLCPAKPILRKARSTPPQMSLKREERLKSPKGAYEVLTGESLPDKIILVDDVFTTGSTLEECAKVLKKAGVAWVGALVLGRTARY